MWWTFLEVFLEVMNGGNGGWHHCGGQGTGSVFWDLMEPTVNRVSFLVDSFFLALKCGRRSLEGIEI